MKTYRRVEVSAFRRRVTIVSGEWPRDNSDAQPAPIDDVVSLNDTDLCEPVEMDSPEGQLLIIEAVRSLERRLSPEARATIHNDHSTLAPSSPNQKRYYLKLQSFYQWICLTARRFARKEK